MVIILNDKTHVGLTPPTNLAQTWISQDLPEISVYFKNSGYHLPDDNTITNIKENLLAHGVDLYSRHVKAYTADSVPEVLRYIDGAWTVVDPALYFDILINHGLVAFTEADAIALDEEVEEFDGEFRKE